MAEWTEQYYDYILSDNDDDGLELLNSIGKTLNDNTNDFFWSTILEYLTLKQSEV